MYCIYTCILYDLLGNLNAFKFPRPFTSAGRLAPGVMTRAHSLTASLNVGLCLMADQGDAM